MNETIDNITRAIDHLDKAQQLFNNGPLEYYLKKLVHHSEALLTKFAPVRAGDKAIIVKEIKCEGGWQGSEKTLAIGNTGYVEKIDYIKNKFVVQFVPDKQWWLNIEGEYIPKDRKHSYSLLAEKIAPIGK